MSWVGQKEVEIPPTPSKNPPRRKQPVEGEESPPPPPLPRVKMTLVKPKLLMNISGKSVALAYKAHIRPPLPSHVIILHDSLSHKPLSLSKKFGGSANGHNGVASVISHLQGKDFHRIRVGIGRPEGTYHNYVLDPLSDKERQWWGECGEGVDRSWEVIEDIIRSSVLKG